MIRQEVAKRPKAAGKQVKQMELFEDEADFGKYRYSCLVSNLDLPAKVIYDSYRGRADSENRIKELKNDFSLDEFVSHNFWAKEACGYFIVMAYNFMSLFRHALINSSKKQFLKTIRYELISTPAYLGKTNDKHILYLARSLKTRQAFLSIWEKLKDFSLPYRIENPNDRFGLNVIEVAFTRCAIGELNSHCARLTATFGIFSFLFFGNSPLLPAKCEKKNLLEIPLK